MRKKIATAGMKATAEQPITAGMLAKVMKPATACREDNNNINTINMRWQQQ